MNIDSIKEYIIPLGLLLLYFFVSAGKKGKKKPSKAPAHVEEEEERPAVRREPPPRRVDPPYESLSTRFENKPVLSTVAARQLNASVKADFSDNIVSQEMQKYSQNDLAIIPTPKRNPSRAGRLFRQKGSLREAMLRTEILTRPLE